MYICLFQTVDPFLTLASLSLRACLAAFSVLPPADNQACLASARDNWTTPAVSARSFDFLASSAGASHNLSWVKGKFVTDKKLWAEHG